MTPGPPQADSFQPNVFQIGPQGQINAVLTGSLLLTESAGTPWSSVNAVTWDDATGTVREFVQGSTPGVGTHEHILQLQAQGDTNQQNFAALQAEAFETVAAFAGSSLVLVNVRDSTQPSAAAVVLLDSLGRSNFPQLAPVGTVNVAKVFLDLRGVAAGGTLALLNATGQSQYPQISSVAKVIVRWGIIQSTGSIFDGSGDFTVAHTGGSGSYTITFTGAAYANAPAVVCTPVGSAFAACTVTALSASAFTVVFFAPTSAPADVDSEFSFLAIGI